MYFRPFIVLILSAAGFFLFCSGNRVIELSDRFMELRGDSTWLIMFYAPWCGHCKKMEPVWNHVAQALYHSDVRVGRVDCTRFVTMATEFKIKGFPTIIFLKGKEQFHYMGDRTEEELVGFAQRMVSEPVPHLPSVSCLQEIISKRKVSFIYAGAKKGSLWEVYHPTALAFREFHFFYSADLGTVQKVVNVEEESAVMVFKDGTSFQFTVSNDLLLEKTALNDSLKHWINHERFPSFVKFTYSNWPQVFTLEKYLVVTVIQETKIGSFEPEQEKFRDMMQSVLNRNRQKYHPFFQFGWTGSVELANSIAMETLPLPHLLAINVSTSQHFFPLKDDPEEQLTPQAVETFLDSVIQQSAKPLGGDTFALRLYRDYYNGKTSLQNMWVGNPVLTSVLFGLPLGFLSLIFYSICCSDILDADEDAREEEPHEKKD